MDTKNDVAESTELRSLYCLCEITPNYVKDGTKFHRRLLLYDTISDKIIPDIDVPSPIAA